jgi:acetyl-CoA acetyltransferase
MKKKLTLDEYMNARPIDDPIHLFDGVMPCAGADAFLVCREDVARSLGLTPIQILSTIERHNAFTEDPIQVRGGWARDIGDLWAMAGLRPADVDLVETYDDYPVIVMMQLEDLGFCKKGEAPDFVRAHSFTTDGTFPHNTSGGQLSTGQAGAAGGFLGLTEAMRQLTDTPIGKPVAGANTAVVSGFGMINYDRGLSSSAVILARAA